MGPTGARAVDYRRGPTVARASVWLIVCIPVGGSIGKRSSEADAEEGWSSFDAALGWIGPQVGFLATEVASGECEGVYGAEGDRRPAIASTTKHCVLSDLAERVAAGAASRDEVAVIPDDLRTMPFGATAYESTGTR